MIFPKGEVRHQNLLTAYTDFPALLSSLKSEGFSGIIDIEYPENKGVIFVDSGKIINAEAKRGEDPSRMIGPEAVRYLLALVNQKDGILNLYLLLPEHVAMIASHLQHEIVFKGLSTDFTQLDHLLLKLKEERHNGYIEVFSKENVPKGVLFFEEGDPVEVFILLESGPSMFGQKSISIFIENVMKDGAILNVYKSQNKLLDGEIVDPLESRKELILIFQEILSKAEKTVDGISRKGKFIEAFKKSLIEKSNDYPFLDPFGGEFTYREGIILFKSSVREKEFARGIADCLRITLSQLKKEIPMDKISPAKWKAEIESSWERHKDRLKRLGMEDIVSSICQ